jgi:hypothetical protein
MEYAHGLLTDGARVCVQLRFGNGCEIECLALAG